MTCPMAILPKLLFLLLLKAGYHPEESIEIMEPANFVKPSIKIGGESKLNKLDSFSAGGGNTFRLLKALYDNSLIQEIRKRVLEVKTTQLTPNLNGRISCINFCSEKSNFQLDSTPLFLTYVKYWAISGTLVNWNLWPIKAVISHWSLKRLRPANSF